jgi:ABC-type uncharacterized transport system involved in gliding motility auxiliary subunit
MSKENKPFHPVLRAGLGVAALAVIAISANIIISSTGLGHKTADFTQNKIYTLSQGTNDILKEIGSPVTIRYYASRSSDYLPADLKLYMKRVDDLLAEYEQISGGKLRVENLDPQPDTDAEDSANMDGIEGQQINDQNLYFGMAITCLDRTVKIPFLNPQDETMLEYNLSRAISQVARPTKPVIGLISALPVLGTPPDGMSGQQGGEPWITFQQLQQDYEVRDLSMTPSKIDPSISLLLVFHPAQITPQAEYAIDQYIMTGGTVIACVDPFSVTAQMLSGNSNPMYGGGLPTSSDLPTLFKSWGVSMNKQVLADPSYATPMQGNRKGLAVLSIPHDGMPDKDNVITRDLNSLVFFLPGGLSKSGGQPLSAQSLVRSTNRAAFVEPMRAAQLDPSLATSLRPSGQAYDMVMHLSGDFSSAFPDGFPVPEGEKKEENKDEKKPESLKKALKPGNAFIISDVDAFFDQFSYRVMNFGNYKMPQQMNGNPSLLLNIVDQAAASSHLIGARSRAAVARPFTRIKDLEAAANEKVGEKIADFEKQAQEAQQKLGELQSQKTRGNDLYLSPEQEAEIHKLKDQEIQARKQVRELQKDLQKEKDKLTSRATVMNVAVMPLIVVITGFGVFLKRRSATRAR